MTRIFNTGLLWQGRFWVNAVKKNEILPIVGSNQNGKALSEMSNIEEVNQMKDLVMWDIERVKPVWG